MANNIAVGVTLPLTKGASGYFAQSYDILTQVKSNLINLLLTTKGERYFQPTFGCDLRALLFEQEGQNFNTIIQTAITNAVQQWMPFLTITSLNVMEVEENQVNIKVSFMLMNNPNITDSITINIGS